MRQFLAIFVFCLALVLASPLSATTYFVTQSGSGAANGTSLANAWSVAQYNASGAPTGGDTVFFSGTLTSTLAIATSGTSNGAGRLTLDFSGSCGGCTVVTFNAGNANVINMNNKNFITLNGGNSAAAPTGGATFAAFNGTQITCKNSNGSAQTGHDFTIQGFIYIGPTAGTGDFFQGGLCTNMLIQNNWADNVGHLVNFFQGGVSGITIRNNFGRTSTDLTQDDDVIQIGDGRNVLIEGNKLILQAPGNNSAPAAHNDVIQTFHSGAGASQNPSGWTVRYNWIELNMGAPFRTGDNSWMQMQNFDNSNGFAIKIYGNVFVGEGSIKTGNNGFGVDANHNTATAYVYNNTVIRKNGPDRTIGWINGGTLSLRNNIGMESPTGQGGTDVDVAQWTPGTGGWDYNFWFQFSGTVTGSSSGPHGSTSTNPQFNNFANDDFSLAVGSPLINAGDSSIGTEFNQGIAPGATWPNPTLVTRSNGAWDVGAFQQGTTSRVNPPTNLTVAVQ